MLEKYSNFASERCRSGRSGRTRNAVNGQLFPGFKFLSFRFPLYRDACHGCLYFFIGLPVSSVDLPAMLQG